MITRFRDQYYFLSNFYTCKIVYNDLEYSSVESAFQAQKTTDESTRLAFTSISSKEARALGRSVRLRDDWHEVRVSILLDLLRIKFKSNPYLGSLLLSTGSKILVEQNYWHDNYWGECVCINCLTTPSDNILGKLLMKVREELKRGLLE